MFLPAECRLVQVEFEDVLPYQDFAVRLPQHYVYKLPEILEQLQNQTGRVSFNQDKYHIYPIPLSTYAFPCRYSHKM